MRALPLGLVETAWPLAEVVAEVPAGLAGECSCRLIAKDGASNIAANAWRRSFCVDGPHVGDELRGREGRFRIIMWGYYRYRHLSIFR